MDNFAALTGGKKAGFAYSATVIIYILFAFVIQSVAGMVLSVDGVAYKALCALCSPLAIGIVVAFFSVREKKNFFETARFVKFDPLYVLPAVMLSTGMLFGLGFLNDAVSELLRDTGLNVVVSTVPLNGFLDLTVFAITLAVLPAVFEEMLFRGVMLGGFDKVNPKIAAVLSALTFAMYHGSLAQFFYQFFYGFGLAYLAVKAGSALPCVIAHFLNNLAVLLLEYFKVYIDFYDGVTIAVGFVLLACVVVFLTFYKGKREKVKHPETKSQALGFVLYAAFGIALAVTLIVSNLLVKV